MKYPKALVLKRGKEGPIMAHHHWIYSGAVEKLPDIDDGEIVAVLDHTGALIGHGYINRRSTIVARMMSFGDEDPIVAFERNLKSAADLRSQLFSESSTNAYRLINGEGDKIPGLVVDKYADGLVIQISTMGMDKLKPKLIEILRELFNPKFIYEKSNLPSRKQENLPQFQGLVYGDMPQKLEVLENGVKFEVDIEKSHKTGMYLDQREMRSLIKGLAKGKRLLNCFSYTGGFSVYAAQGGAKTTTSVDIAAEAINLAKQNFALNGFDPEDHSFITADVFKYLRENELNFDIVILDPPAFAKSAKDVSNAINGYRDINRLAMKKMPRGSLLLTCSCSYHVDEELFQKVLYQAAKDSGKQVQILQKHHLASDHPINIFHPEANYLKSFLLYLS